MINKLVFENLKHRWVRTVLSALVIGVQVATILTLVGLSRGMLQDSARRAEGVGADIWIKPDGAGAFTMSSAQISEKFIDFFRKQPNVKVVTGMLIQPILIPLTINGVDLNEFNQLSGGFQYVEGGALQNPDDILVDEYYAAQNKVKVGQTINVLNRPWRVAGIIGSGTLARLVVSLKALQDITSNSNRVSQIVVKLDNPAKTDEMVTHFNQELKGTLRAYSTRDYTSLFTVQNLPQLQAFITVITILSVVVGFLVVFLSMYTAVLERTREIGILKALGAKPGKIIDILIRETVILASIGFVIGIILSYGAKSLIMGLVPASLQVVSVPDWWPYAAAIAIGGALLGAIYPGLKAAKQDAIEALAYD